MGINPRSCCVLLLTATLVACDSDSDSDSASDNQEHAAIPASAVVGNTVVDDVGTNTESGVQTTESDEATGRSNSVINDSNYLSLLQIGLDVAQNRLSGDSLFLDLSEFTTATADSTGSIDNQPCVAGGTYDLSLTPSENPGGLESGFINTPIQTYSFTACNSAGNTAISGSYKLSEYFETDLSDFTASIEEVNATITGVLTADGPEDVTMSGTLDRSLDAGTSRNSFDVDSFAITDAAGGTLEVAGTGRVEDGAAGILLQLDMTLIGSSITPANPGVSLTLTTEGVEEGILQSLIVVDGSMVSRGSLVLSAADGSRVRAEASDDETIADISVTSGNLIFTDSRPWTEIVP